MAEHSPPVLGFAGYSGSGKTTLLSEVVKRLRDRGLCIGLIKHTHHEFDIDHPGKDSHTLRQAGASRIAVGSSRRWALIVERPSPQEATLQEMLTCIADSTLDLVLVEGFRDEPYPKIEVFRAALGRPLLAATDASIIAVATDRPEQDTHGRPLLDLNDPAAVETFVHHFLFQGSAATHPC